MEYGVSVSFIQHLYAVISVRGGYDILYPKNLCSFTGSWQSLSATLAGTGRYQEIMQSCIM